MRIINDKLEMSEEERRLIKEISARINNLKVCQYCHFRTCNDCPFYGSTMEEDTCILNLMYELIMAVCVCDDELIIEELSTCRKKLKMYIETAEGFKKILERLNEVTGE